MKLPRVLIAGWVAWILTLFSGGVRAGEAELARVRAEFPGAMTRLEESLLRGQLSGSCEMRETNWQGIKIRRTIEFINNGSWKKATVTMLDDPSDSDPAHREVFCMGPKGYFFVDRKSTGKPYVIHKVGENDSDHAVGTVTFFLNAFLMAPCGVLKQTMSETLASPTFQFRSAEPVTERGANLFKIDITDPAGFFRSGTIWACPDEGWAIHKADCLAYSGQQRVISNVEYAAPQNGLPVPRLVSYFQPIDKPGLKDNHLRYEIDHLTFGPTPDREFTLAAYGLPDVNTPLKNLNRDTSPAWFIGGGLAVLAIAAGLTLYSRRRAAGRVEA